MRRLYLFVLVLAACMACAFPASAQDSLAALLQRPAPNFALTDTTGTLRTLVAYRHRPVVLFFFCGCSLCAECARAWGQFQRGNALPHAVGRDQRSQTLIVYAGDPGAAQNLADQTGLDMDQTVLLPDLHMDITLRLYKSDPCPRAFVLDSAGVVRYINCHKDDAPGKAPVMALVSRTLQALRTCSADTAGVAAQSQTRRVSAVKPSAWRSAQRARKSKRRHRLSRHC